MNHREAIDSLAELGLGNYEARVFVALQKLGAGTASAISDHSEVPRSQVYGAADTLEERGLVEVEPGTPKRYRPVDLDDAKRRLLDRLEGHADSAFSILESIDREDGIDDARQESIWTIRGSETVTDRIASLVETASDRVVYYSSASLHTPSLADSFEAARRRGCRVLVISTDESVLEWAASIDGVETARIPDVELDDSDGFNRSLLVDDDTMLFGIYSDQSAQPDETGIYSTETAIARTLVDFYETQLEQLT